MSLPLPNRDSSWRWGHSVQAIIIWRFSMWHRYMTNILPPCMDCIRMTSWYPCTASPGLLATRSAQTILKHLQRRREDIIYPLLTGSLFARLLILLKGVNTFLLSAPALTVPLQTGRSYHTLSVRHFQVSYQKRGYPCFMMSATIHVRLKNT